MNSSLSMPPKFLAAFSNREKMRRHYSLSPPIKHSTMLRWRSASRSNSTGRASRSSLAWEGITGWISGEALRTSGRESQPTSELAEHREQIRQSLEQPPARTIAEACQRIKDLTGIERGPTQVRQFLKGRGRKWPMVRAIPVPPKKTWRSMLPTKLVSGRATDSRGANCCTRSPRWD